MAVWEWENIAFYFDPVSLVVRDFGPLLAPIERFAVRRDDEGALILKTITSGYPREVLHEIAAGTVRTVTEAVTFEGHPEFKLPYHAIANGVVPIKYKTKSRPQGRVKTTQTSLIQSIEGFYQNDVDVVHIIEWIENFNHDGFIFSGASITNIEEISKTITLKSDCGKIELSEKGRSHSVSNVGLRLVIDDTELYICSASEGDDKKSNRGFIIYVGNISEEKRQKIRVIISFCLGMYIGCLGCVALDGEGKAVFVKFFSAERISSSASRLPALPPAPLWIQYQNEIHQDVVAKMANAIFAKYESLHFAKLSWAYWHAACAPVHMAAAHYGAALESLQRACAEDSRIRKTLISNNDWQKLKSDLILCISGSDLEDNIREIFFNKISGLNNLPQDKAMDEILAILQLPTGPLERSAWKRRHQAAHGASVSQTDFTAIIRETKLLRILLHRIVLAATGASDRYIDYYSLGFPVRKLHEPVTHA